MKKKDKKEKKVKETKEVEVMQAEAVDDIDTGVDFTVKKVKEKKKKPVSKREKLAAKKKAALKEADDSGIFDKKKKGREVTSYEDLPLEDNGRARFASFTNSNKKSISRAVIILLVLTLSVLFFSNRDHFNFRNIKNFVSFGIFNSRSDEIFPHKIDGSVVDNGNFVRVNTNLVYASDTHFVSLNRYGRTDFHATQSYSNPVLKSASDSDLTLVYNLGGKEFSINNLDGNVYKGEAQDKILVADIAKSGTYALVTEKDGYLSKLYVYNKDNMQIYAYSFADYYVTSISLDSKGDSAIVSGISAHDGTHISAVYVLDFAKEKPLVFQEFTGNIIYHVEHLNDKVACVIGADATYTLNIRRKVFNTYEYSGKTLTAFDVNTDTNTFAVSLSRSGDGRMCDIVNFNSRGKIRKTVSTNLAVTSLSTYKNRFVVLSDDIAYLYNKEGTLISKLDAGLDPHSVVLYSKNKAYVLGVSEIGRLVF